MNLEDFEDATIDDPRFAEPGEIREEGEEELQTERPRGGADVGGEGQAADAFPADGRSNPLHPNYVSAARFSGWITAGFFCLGMPVGLGALWLVNKPGFLLTSLIVLAGFFFLGACIFSAHYWPVLEKRHTRWRLDADGLEIRRGVIWRHTISVPCERIQHTDVRRGPIQRRFGLATLSVHTAGNHDSQIDLAGIGIETAQALRRTLLNEKQASQKLAARPVAEPEPSTQSEEVPEPLVLPLATLSDTGEEAEEEDAVRE